MAEGPKSSFKVIIIGAGLSGTLLANGLSNSNIPYTLYERDKADSKREGYQIRLGGPSLEGMRTCLTQPDLHRIVSKFGRAAGKKAVAPNILDRDFRPLINLSAFKNYAKSAAINRVVLRDELMKQLQADQVVYERRFERLEIVQRNGAERVKVYFAGGYEDEADVVIGADGNHSKINQQLGLNNIAPLDTHYAFISKADVSVNDLRDLPPKLLEGPNLAFSNDLSLYFATYLPDMDPSTHDIKTGSCMFSLYVPTQHVTRDPTTMTASEKLDILRLNLRDWHPRFHQMLDIVKDTDPYVYTAHVSTRPPTDWRRIARKEAAATNNNVLGHPRIWLMGDAIHAMLPYRGMGGNQSMLDAGKMLPYLQTLHTQSLNNAAAGHEFTNDEVVQQAQEAYETEMMARTFEWVEKSGGRNIMPFDSANWWTWYGFAAFRPVWAVYCGLYSLWTRIVGEEGWVDDAPELK